MTRRIYLDNGSNSITVSSIYDKLDNVARWNAVNNPINENGWRFHDGERFVRRSHRYAVECGTTQLDQGSSR